MSKSLVEFKRFLVKSAPTLSEYEKKLANLILGGFDEIAAVGSAGGRRGKVLPLTSALEASSTMAAPR